jgi:Predicted signal transduction protein with a C-terminal ATPase domain
MMNFFLGSLQRKMMAILVCITAIPLLVLGIFIYIYSSEMVERDFIDNSRKYLNQVSKNLDDDLRHMEMLTMMAFTDRNVRNVLRSDNGDSDKDIVNSYSIMEQFLTNISILRKDISGVYIFSNRNVYYQYLYDTGVDFDYKYKEDEWYKETVKKGGAVVLIGTHKPFQRKNSSDYVFSLSRVIVDTLSGEMLGVILIDANFGLISELGDSMADSGKGWIVITNKKGDIIYSPDRSELTKKIGIDISLLKKASGNSLIDGKDGKLFMNFITSDYSGWKIIQFIPQRLVYRTPGLIGLFIFIIALTLVLLTLALSFFVSRSISKPVVSINQSLQKIGKGDFAQRSSINREDEIGQLSRGVDEMAVNLKELVERVALAQTKQKEAELKSLQNQINPHFLYNTLNSIQMIAKINKQENIAQMADDLGMLFKISLNKGKDIVRLKQEFHHVELYIKLQKIRYGDKINYLIQADENIMDFLTIKLILQPIVENAIYHGLEKKNGIGTLKIEGCLKEDLIMIRVEDDGVGISNEQLENIRNALDGRGGYDPKMMNIGIINVHERLKLYFGDEYGLQLDSTQGKGTIVIIRLPLIKNGDVNDDVKLSYY